jgi:hypothetical protein
LASGNVVARRDAHLDDRGIGGARDYFVEPLPVAAVVLEEVLEESLDEESFAPESFAPESLEPESLAAEPLEPESLDPESLDPSFPPDSDEDVAPPSPPPDFLA